MSSDVLDIESQKKLNVEKTRRKFTNEVYLRNHPEIKLLLANATEGVLKDKPEDVLKYLINFFTKKDLKDILKNT